jgi:uncharacterized membrane protein YeaQ/YmgE (transglycosylase-associated protein family)
MPGKQNIGLIVTILLGAIGSFLVGIIFAVVLIAGYLGITGRRSSKTPR